MTRALLARSNGHGSGEGTGGLATLPGSPDARRAQDKQHEQEVREAYERHIRETGERPKEHAIRMAADKQYAAQQQAEAAQAIGEALERIKQRERHARDIVAWHKLESQARADRWRQAWPQKEVEDSLKGLLKPALQSAEEQALRMRLNDAREALRKLQARASGAELSEADALRRAAAEQRAKEAGEALESKREEFARHRELQQQRADKLIESVVNPDVSGRVLSQVVEAFLRTAPSSVNLTKKLSELVAAKAVWFSGSDPVELAPGRKAIEKGADSPDYTSGANIIGDNFRVEGVAPARGEIALEPDPIAHARPIQNVRNAITKGIKSKVTTYFQTHVKLGKRVVVTVDVSDCPWVLQQAHLSKISVVADENAGVIAHEGAGLKMSIADCLHAVYFVVDGHAYRVFPGWRSPGGFDPPTRHTPSASSSSSSSSSAGAPVSVPTKSKASKVNVKGPSTAVALTLGEDLQKLVDRTRELLADNASALDELKHVLLLFEQRRMAPKGEQVEAGSRRVLGDVLTKLNAFLERHGKRVRGDFVKRIWRSLVTRGDPTEAEGELEAATAILEGTTPLGAVQSVEAIPESDVPGVETPEFRVVQESGATALVEVKTIGSLTDKAVKTNLNKAISQIRYQADSDAATGSQATSSETQSAPKPASATHGGGLIRINATAGEPSQLGKDEQISLILRWIKGELTQLRGPEGQKRRGTDFVRFVEVLYRSAAGTVTVVFECVGAEVKIHSVASSGGHGASSSSTGEKGVND